MQSLMMSGPPPAAHSLPTYLETDGHRWSSLSKKRPLTLPPFPPPLCHVIFATLRASGDSNGFQKMPRGGGRDSRRDRSLALFAFVRFILSGEGESFTSGGNGRRLSDIFRAIFSKFLLNFSSSVVRVRPPLINC